MLINHEESTFIRLADLTGIIPAVTGKIELVYEGELEGPAKVANILMGKAIKSLFARFFPDPEKAKKSKTANPYQLVTDWFTDGHTLDIADHLTAAGYEKQLMEVSGLHELVKKFHPKLSASQTLLLMEFVLHGLAEYSQLSKKYLDGGFGFSDMFDSLFNSDPDDDEDDDDNDTDFRF